MNILITGSTGFVGRHLVPQLIKRNFNILELTRNIKRSEDLFGQHTQKYLITDEQDALTDTVIKFNPEIVIHLASYLTAADTYTDLRMLIDVNIFFPARIMDSLKETNLELFINTGTFAEYFSSSENFDPAYLYASTKTASRSILDYYAKAYNFSYATVTPYTIYGGTDDKKKIIDHIYDSLNSERPLDLSPGEQVLDFIHIADIVDFYLLLVNNRGYIPPKTNFPAGTGKGNNLKQLARIFEQQTGMKANINWGGKPYRNTDIMYAVADISLQKKLFNWQPRIELEEGIMLYLTEKNNNRSAV
jgi:nucleoside-diphosphate-sugar epimerase